MRSFFFQTKLPRMRSVGCDRFFWNICGFYAQTFQKLSVYYGGRSPQTSVGGTFKKCIGPFFEKFPTGPTKTCHSMLIMFYFPNEIKYLGINVWFSEIKTKINGNFEKSRFNILKTLKKRIFRCFTEIFTYDCFV